MAVGNGSIELAGLVKSYDGITRAVDGVNLKIPDGAYCCFLGPSGCGKTTILRMIAGHEDPSDGEILIGGENVVGLAPVERDRARIRIDADHNRVELARIGIAVVDQLGRGDFTERFIGHAAPFPASEKLSIPPTS